MNRQTVSQLFHDKVVVPSCRNPNKNKPISALSPIPENSESGSRRKSRSEPAPDGNEANKDINVRRQRRRLPDIPRCIALNDPPRSPTMLSDNRDSGAMNNSEEHVLRKIEKEHRKMDRILSDRILKLRAARSMCNKSEINNLVTYLIRIQDKAVLFDLLLVIQQLVERDARCVIYATELIPQLNQLLGSNYEEYISRTLDLLITIMKAKFCLSKTSRLREISEIPDYLRQERDIIKQVKQSSGAITEKINKFMLLLKC